MHNNNITKLHRSLIILSIIIVSDPAHVRTKKSMAKVVRQGYEDKNVLLCLAAREHDSVLSLLVLVGELRYLVLHTYLTEKEELHLSPS